MNRELSRRGLTEAGLALRRKGEPQKAELAGALRARTTMILKWIAQRLNMGAWSYVSNCLVEKRKKDGKCQ